MKRATLYLSLNIGLLLGFATAMTAQGPSSSILPDRQSRTAQEFRPSYEVHISPTRMTTNSTSFAIAPDSFSARGFDLRTLIAQIYDVDIRRIDFPDEDAAAARYDVTLVLPKEESQETTQRLLEDALQKRFRLKITAESRAMDVYVLTAPQGPGPALHRHNASVRSAGSNGLLKRASLDESELEMEDAQRITYQGKECSGVASGGISVAAGTISEFRRTLEPDLDRLLVDDTRLSGSYDFQIGNYRNEQELFQLLRDQLGLVVVPTERKVVVLAVRSV